MTDPKEKELDEQLPDSLTNGGYDEGIGGIDGDTNPPGTGGPGPGAPPPPPTKP